MWFDVPLVYPGSATPNGPTVAGLTIAAKRDDAVVHIDVIGVGSAPYDFLHEAGQQVVGVNVAESATGTDKSGRLRFKNLRSELVWRMRDQEFGPSIRRRWLMSIPSATRASWIISPRKSLPMQPR